jgi:NAD(P)-dependent dehydrogenase (short-subunit alcohol dehydrogenase family)
MSGITVITGANRGIGLELARQSVGRGERVVAAVRTAGDALGEIGLEVIEGVDVSSEQGLAILKKTIGSRRVSRLICNAGVLTRETLSDLDLDRIRRQFEVNALGPLRTVAALLDCLEAGSKVGIVTSRMGSIGDNTSGSMYGYRISKAAVNAAGVSLARDLAPSGIAVVLLHPGYVRTEMTGNNGYVDPDHAARGLLARLDELTVEHSGTFRHADGQTLPW